MKFRHRLLQWCNAIWRHKYIWTTILFVVIVGFVDDNSFWQRYLLVRQNNETREEIRSYEEQYKRDCEKLRRLKTDPQALIRVAREDHRMKSADEDVYYIIDEDSTAKPSK